jgi:hypothetical protein
MCTTSNLTADRRPVPAVGPKQRLVERSEFLELLVSTRRFYRCDELSRGLRGLVDLETGERFMIQEKRLFTKQAMPA